MSETRTASSRAGSATAEQRRSPRPHPIGCARHPRSCKAYSADDPLEVRYDPEDPGRAVIEKGGALKGWLMIGFGLLLLGLGVRTALRARSRA